MFPPSILNFDIRPRQSGASEDVVFSHMANAASWSRASWDAFRRGRVNQRSRLHGSAPGSPRRVAERVYDRPPECSLTILPTNCDRAAPLESTDKFLRVRWATEGGSDEIGVRAPNSVRGAKDQTADANLDERAGRGGLCLPGSLTSLIARAG